ncbi:hypothetical protein HII36_38600 [Nonomuraea sp. NN258]|uniref:hypothetical protein n=1 Tax=Nonomuraea antri TaxID=2730852 RepID=UPI00156978F7|nr:hypothetical protein [Nonomuraea antri]NRQ37699.1 hypothetical protein [Nonomuraea antri]
MSRSFRAKAARRLAARRTMAVIGWIVLGAGYFLFIPIFHAIGLFAVLVIGAGWTWAVLWSIAAVVSYLAVRSYGRAAAGLAIAVAAGALLWTTDWTLAHVRSVLWLGEAGFAELAADYESGRPIEVQPWMSYLVMDGEAEAQPGALYFPVFVDWRGEYGEGFAYLRGGGSPQAVTRTQTLIQTAPGDLGEPAIDLGGGWWWVE